MISTRIFAAVSLSALLLAPSASAITFLPETDALPDISSPYTDVSPVAYPGTSDLNALDNYYQLLGISVLSNQVFNGKDQLVGYTAADGTRYFSPNQFLNRAEAAQLLFNVNPIGYYYADLNKSCLNDINSSYWYSEEACSLYREGIINGYPDGSFGGGNTLNNAELIKMIVNTYEIADVDEGAYSVWWQGYYDAAVSFGIILDPSSFDASASPTRGEVVGYILRALAVQETGEVFSQEVLTEFFESLMDAGREEAFVLDAIYDNGPIDFYSLSYFGPATDEVFTLLNTGTNAVDLSGYTLKVLDDNSGSGYEDTGLFYTFPEGTSIEPGKYANIYGAGGDANLGYSGSSGWGIINDIDGDYLVLLYDDSDILEAVLVFAIP